MKKKFLVLIYLICIFSFNSYAEQKTELVNKISKNLRCLICQGQSVYDSQSEFSESVKLLIKRKINEGKSEQEIYKFFEEKYGKWILFDPSISKNTLFLWSFPIVLFLLAGLLIARKVTIK